MLSNTSLKEGMQFLNIICKNDLRFPMVDFLRRALKG